MAGRYDIQLRQGEAFRLGLALRSPSGAYLSLAGVPVACQVRRGTLLRPAPRPAPAPDLLFDFAATPGALDYAGAGDPALPAVYLVLAPRQSAALPPGLWCYDAFLGEAVTHFGTFAVLARVTRRPEPGAPPLPPSVPRP